ncbi:MAG TPA: hypothetical protein VEJ20_04490, partial [Candidatus Eremiobacteraceae bacterium]|nr:hypothetical protein [Candidatus Eremiobacteraceae bacterium]
KARTLYREAIEKLRALGDERRVGGALTNLGALEQLAGDALEAKRCLTDALAMLSGKKNARDLTVLYANLSITQLSLGEISDAREAARAELRYALDLQDERNVAESMIHFGSIAARCGDIMRAARLSGYGRSRLESIGLAGYLADLPAAVSLERSLHAQLVPAELTRLTAEGAAWPRKQAIDEAMKV